MVKLTDEQAQLFLGKNFGAVATIRPDGTPHVTPVWVDYDGEHVVFNTATGRAKWHHMQRDPRVTIEVYSQDDPYDYVTVTGRSSSRRARRPTVTSTSSRRSTRATRSSRATGRASAG